MTNSQEILNRVAYVSRGISNYPSQILQNYTTIDFMSVIRPQWKSAANLRSQFVKYFKNEHSHGVVKSDSLIPHNDPTLLFTNAGMVQFKDVILGHVDPPGGNPRAVSVQRCMRAGGKHNDLDNVGMTPRHHTFFEMLGNFSFGDYFKEEAILMAWDFVTNKDFLGLPAEKLRVTTHFKDSESKSLWQKISGLPEERILSLGDEDNFWSMGDTGPCGPCTEIFFDRGDDFKNDDDRWLEIWNLVFMEFEKSNGGILSPLPLRCVDTGMGLERIASVVQNVESNYQTDEFVDILNTIELFISDHIGKKLQRHHGAFPPHGSDECALRVLADHTRACAHLIADGVVPSNVGRGYVLRRIIRRALRYCKAIGVNEPVLADLINLVAARLDISYSNLPGIVDIAVNIIRNEETAFFGTLERGLTLLEQELSTSNAGTLSGDFVFHLYDTHGFPADITAIVANEKGWNVDLNDFDARMEDQREKNRTFSKLSGSVENTIINMSNVPPSVMSWEKDDESPTNYGFVGYDNSNLEIIASLDKVHWLNDENNEVDGQDMYCWVSLDACPFYPEGGGQVSDRGEVRILAGVLEGVVFEVLGATKTQPGVGRANDIALLLKYTSEYPDDIEMLRSNIAKGTPVYASVLKNWRRSNEAHHTATHILQAGLRNMFGSQITQAGSLVDPQKLRFDFTHGTPLSEENIEELEIWINNIANMDCKVEINDDVPLDEARRKGALAMFGEKYEDTVRVVNIPDISMELCGGTHVETTGKLRPFKIISEASAAAGVRRIEAVAGNAAVEWYKMREVEGLSRIGELVLPNENKILNPSIVYERVLKLIDENKNMKATIELMRKEAWGGNAKDNERAVDGVTVCSIKAIGSRVKIPETRVDILFITLPEALKPENAKTKKDRKKMQQDCMKTLLDKLDEMKDEQPKSVHIVCDGQRIAIAWADSEYIENNEVKYAHELIQLLFKAKTGKGGGTAKFSQGQFSNYVTKREVIEAAGFVRQ